MTAHVELKNNVHLTLISVYGPTMQRPELENEQFYEQLGECITSAKEDGIIVLGDFNARVGKDWESWPSVIGRHGNVHPVKSKQGELLSAPEDIKDRWVEHFDELLNQPTNVDWEILNEVDQLPTIDEFDDPISMDELETALKNTKLRKSPGPDGRGHSPWW
ncbi:uncharacterized protein [Diadema antillarum]|uniref:uncharacterized protein n=1 Tax=Diadema antillarum TaxID=105358 RepID=UPI003A861004